MSTLRAAKNRSFKILLQIIIFFYNRYFCQYTEYSKKQQKKTKNKNKNNKKQKTKQNKNKQQQQQQQPKNKNKTNNKL